MGALLWYSGLRIQHGHLSLQQLWYGFDPWPLAWELPHAAGMDKKKKKKENKRNHLLPYVAQFCMYFIFIWDEIRKLGSI